VALIVPKKYLSTATLLIDARDEQTVPRERTSLTTISASPLVATKPEQAPPQAVTDLP